MGVDGGPLQARRKRETRTKTYKKQDSTQPAHLTTGGSDQQQSTCTSGMSYYSLGQWQQAAAEEQVCGACGMTGHRRTNRNCPFFCSRKVQCGGCGGYGHRKDNKRCPLYSINKQRGIVKERKGPEWVKCPAHHTPFELPNGSVEMVRTTKPCKCGGTTGLLTSELGLRKYEKHRASRQHIEWEKRRRAARTAQRGELKSYRKALRAGDVACKCDYCYGGVTGVDGSAEGARLYRAHMQVCPMDRV